MCLLTTFGISEVENPNSNRQIMKLKRENIFSVTILAALITIFAIAPAAAPGLASGQAIAAQAADSKPAKNQIEKRYLSNIRQLTFEGKRAGEGYFSADGSLMVFQSERRADNPFFQIYLMDLENGDVEPVSPGHGKTTCAWVHKDNNLVLYSSTQDDPEARNKQKAEIEFRESGQSRRYSWDYDQTYEIYSYDRAAKTYSRLTNSQGYDAEGSYSPDGGMIAFASNRNGFTKKLSAEEKKKFENDPAYMMDIFIMNADGTNVRQLTDVPGYDGGPFFSPDGKKICWRRFSESGVTAEIMTMNLDGSEQKKLTRIGAMSWAPFYHPSGEYLIFTTNKHGFRNFELYLVDANGKSAPVRITDTDGFDGLASFTPDGNKLTWTTNRTPTEKSQIFLGDWNHKNALKSIASSHSAATGNDAETRSAFTTGTKSAEKSNVSFDPRDIIRHVDFLCRKELGGRMTGTIGERKATAYVAAYLDYLGAKPAGDNGTWFQEFEFPNGARLGQINDLTVRVGDESKEFTVDKDWRPLTFSGNVTVDPTEVVYAGYGIVAPKKDEQDEYDSYVHLDVKDKWVMVFRFVPENLTPEQRLHFKFYGDLRKKAFHARQNGAKGLIVVSGPNSQVRKQLVPMQNDFSPSGSSIAAISVTDEVAKVMLSAGGKDLQELQDKLDDGNPIIGFNLDGFKVAATVDVQKITGKGRNVVGRMMAGDKPSDEAVIVGAHIDHLGAGKSNNSLAKQDEKNNIHFGADDNASGVAAMLEIAEYIASQKKSGKLQMKRDIVFAGWSGEELGLHGSQHFVESIQTDAPSEKKREYTSHDFVLGITSSGGFTINEESATKKDIEDSLGFISKNYSDFEVEIVSSPDTPAEKVEALAAIVKNTGVKNVKKTTQEAAQEPAASGIVAALNMDMVGRLTDKLVLQGISSSSYWPGVIESKNVVVGLPLTLSNETDLPTDASSFYRAGIPILSAFTGSHTDYHTPRDTPEKLNYPDAARISKLMGLITRDLVKRDEVPDYIKQESQPKEIPRGGVRAYLGSVPSYGDDVVGVKLSDVTAGAPAAKAGVLGGDIIIELAGKKIENIYDYTAVIDGLKIGQETTIAVLRDDKRLEFKITPSSRQ